MPFPRLECSVVRETIRVRLPGWFAQSEYAGPALLSWRLGFAAVPDVPHSGGPAGLHAHEECVHFIASHKLKALSPEHWPLSAKVTDLPCVCS